MPIYTHTAGDRTPFSYVIHCLTTNQYYYGVRYGKGCHPDQLWTSYFTSSKNIKVLVEEHGVSNFKTYIRRIFDCPKLALSWESKVLRRLRVISKPKWLNQSDGANFRHNGTLSDAVKQQMSKTRKGVPKPRSKTHQANLTAALKGKPSPQKGKPLSTATKKKLSVKAKGRPSARKGTVTSEEHRLKIAEAKKGKPSNQVIDEKEKIIRSKRAIANNFGKVAVGLIWVNDGIKSTRIKPEHFEASGFIRGRLKS